MPPPVRAALHQTAGRFWGYSVYCLARLLALGMFLFIEASTTRALQDEFNSPSSAEIQIGLVIWVGLPAIIAMITYRTYQTYRQYELVETCTGVIRACAEAHAAGFVRRPQRLQQLSTVIRRLEGNVLRAYRTRGAGSYPRHRRAELRRHARDVVAALRAAEARLDDTDQEQALEKLADLVLTIAENYAAGRVGALLPTRALEGHPPFRDYELVRVGAVVVAIVGVSVGVAVLLPDLSDAAAGALVVGSGLLALLLAFRRRWHQYLPIADLFKPGGP